VRWLTGKVVPALVTPNATDHRWVRLPRPLWGAYWVLRPIRQMLKVSSLLASRKSRKKAIVW